MKLAKSILYGTMLLVLASASATAGDPPADTASAGIAMDSSAGASASYAIDDDRDGRTDRELMLEQSDSLA